VSAKNPPTVEVTNLSKRFGSVQALDSVSARFEAGRLHALLGENGAGKSTLVKCLLGYHQADAGRIAIDGRTVRISHPGQAHALGLGMVYQHFTVVPEMTVAENFILGKETLPARIRWPEENDRLRAFMAKMPFQLDPERKVSTLAAGEKQKLEIVKQLYLGRRFLVLDEPTSVLTPAEADEVLGEMRRLANAHELTVVLITHKFREVDKFAEDVTVLRAGKLAGSLSREVATKEALAAMMFGKNTLDKPHLSTKVSTNETSPFLHIAELHADGDRGTPVLNGVNIAVYPGQIVGVAGVSGNGQKELVEVLAGQRALKSGAIFVDGREYSGTRKDIKRAGVSLMAEEPLTNSAVRSLSVMENLALRQFDEPPLAVGRYFLNRLQFLLLAKNLIARYRIRASSPYARLDTLSGGNVQRAVLARELSRDVNLLIIQNPCFGLDEEAANEIRKQIVQARDRGAAVLLISEDLDEIMEISDRILVFSGGAVTYETGREKAEVYEIGRHMAGAHAA
jgi:simple sugar transport system ATP-binding protein